MHERCCFIERRGARGLNRERDYSMRQLKSLCGTLNFYASFESIFAMSDRAPRAYNSYKRLKPLGSADCNCLVTKMFLCIIHMDKMAVEKG